MDALKVAYGPDYLDLLKGQYRKGRPKGGLGKTIRQGVRIGLTQENAAAMAKHVGVVAEADLEAAAKQLQEQGKLEENLRNILGRFELAVDARIDAALALAESQYVGYVRMLASACQWRSKKGPPWRCKKGPLGGCGLVPVVHGRAPRATRRALNRLTRRRAREGPVGPRGQAWAGWSVQLAVGV